MTTWKQTAARVIGDLLDVRIARKGRLGMQLEADLLTVFLREFAIDCVFDVGANQGQYARLLRQIGYRGTIVSVEPIPALVKVLRADARRDPRWHIEAGALDETERDVVFNIMARSQFSSLKQPAYIETSRFDEMNVVVETLCIRTERLEHLYDRYEQKLGFRRPFLKMDTQGNDVAVARGAGTRLAAFAGLQSELAVRRLYEGQCDFREALDFYWAAGFVLTSFMPNNAGHFPDLIELDSLMYNPRFLVEGALLPTVSGALPRTNLAH